MKIQGNEHKIAAAGAALAVAGIGAAALTHEGNQAHQDVAAVEQVSEGQATSLDAPVTVTTEVTASTESTADSATTVVTEAPVSTAEPAPEAAQVESAPASGSTGSGFETIPPLTETRPVPTAFEQAEAAAEAMRNPKLGDQVNHLLITINLQPGADMYGVPNASKSNFTELAREKRVQNPRYYLDAESQQPWLCFNGSEGLQCSADFAHMTYTDANGNVQPFGFEAAGQAVQPITEINQDGKIFVGEQKYMVGQELTDSIPGPNGPIHGDNGGQAPDDGYFHDDGQTGETDYTPRPQGQ